MSACVVCCSYSERDWEHERVHRVFYGAVLCARQLDDRCYAYCSVIRSLGLYLSLPVVTGKKVFNDTSMDMSACVE